MNFVSTTKICGTDNNFDRPSGTGASLHHYPGTSFLFTISLSLRDKSHSPIDAPQNYLSADGVSTPGTATRAMRREGAADRAY
jgi:hypothetical protein